MLVVAMEAPHSGQSAFSHTLLAILCLRHCFLWLVSADYLWILHYIHRSFVFPFSSCESFFRVGFCLWQSVGLYRSTPICTGNPFWSATSSILWDLRGFAPVRWYPHISVSQLSRNFMRFMIIDFHLFCPGPGFPCWSNQYLFLPVAFSSIWSCCYYCSWVFPCLLSTVPWQLVSLFLCFVPLLLRLICGHFWSVQW